MPFHRARRYVYAVATETSEQVFRFKIPGSSSTPALMGKPTVVDGVVYVGGRSSRHAASWGFSPRLPDTTCTRRCCARRYRVHVACPLHRPAALSHSIICPVHVALLLLVCVACTPSTRTRHTRHTRHTHMGHTCLPIMTLIMAVHTNARRYVVGVDVATYKLVFQLDVAPTFAGEFHASSHAPASTTAGCLRRP